MSYTFDNRRGLKSVTKCFILLCLACLAMSAQLEDSSEDEPPISQLSISCSPTEEGIECNGRHYEAIEETTVSANSPKFWLYIGIIAFLVAFAGLMSGLTIGLNSLDLLNLEILKNVGEPTESKHAAKIIPVVKKHHLLLVTLLLANALAMETLPIFLDRLTSPVAAILISVTLILLFGEVIPQALCTRYGLAIGAHTAWLVKFLMVLFFVISWPLSKLLDYLLGSSHETLFRRQELRELVQMHSIDHQGPLTADECTIIRGALDMRNKKVSTCMTPLESVFMLPIEMKLKKETLKEIYATGHSRIPIYSGSKQNLVGILIVKRLILLDLNEETPLQHIELPPLPTVPSTMELYDMLNEFQTGKSHMVAVIDEQSKQILGIVTLEDVIEELIQEEIIDETDVFVDVSKKVKVAGILRQFATPKGGRKPRLNQVIVTGASGASTSEDAALLAKTQLNLNNQVSGRN